MSVYSQIFLQIVFSVNGRSKFIRKSFKEELHKYIAGTVENKKHKLYAINSVSDHIHMLISFDPNENISLFIRDIKRSSALFINEQKWIKGFSWQRGCGIFSYSKSQTNNVVKYIMNQEEHHKRKTFREEFIKLLEIFEIKYKTEHLFEFYDVVEENE